MIVALASAEHVAPWMALVREVEPLFGPMPDFQSTLKRKIAQSAALCAMNDNTLAGGMLLGGAAPHFRINWLAVTAAQRRHGAARVLVDAALQRFAPPCTVHLDTFIEEEPEGRPARQLYETYGFVAGEVFNFEGMPRQRYALTRSR